MPITFTPVELDTGSGDRSGLVVFNDGRLTAVLSCLDDVHGEAAGQWFVEATFRPMRLSASRTYATPEAFADAFRSTASSDWTVSL